MITRAELERRLKELQKIKTILSRVKEESIRVKEVGLKGTPSLGEERCLRGFGFFVPQMGSVVDERGEWNESAGGTLELDEKKVGRNIKWARIHYLPLKKTFICETFLGTATITDEETVNFLSAVPVKDGRVIDIFKEFVSYTEWFISMYIMDKKQRILMRGFSGIFRRIQEK
jgi:hypothetical protein